MPVKKAREAKKLKSDNRQNDAILKGYTMGKGSFYRGHMNAPFVSRTRPERIWKAGEAGSTVKY
jgi:hypothetical protein